MNPHQTRMPSPRAPWTAGLLALATATTLASCGGGSSAPAGVSLSLPDAVPASPTTLAIGVPHLAMRVSGQARTLTLTNTGGAAAENLTLAPEVLPFGISLSGSTCGASLAPGESCHFTFTPGATPTAAPGDQAPAAALVEISGSNTNTASASLHVVDHGSVHQGGYVFAIDDSTPAAGSIGGKVLALNDVASLYSWAGTPLIATPVPGTRDNAESPCQGATDGACNSVLIDGSFGDSTPAASLCLDSTDGGFGDWYLPALCEMTYNRPGEATGVCGTQAAPRLADNLQSRLAANGDIGGLASKTYLSSTAYSGDPLGAHVFAQVFGAPDGAAQVVHQTAQHAVRCVRALTQP